MKLYENKRSELRIDSLLTNIFLTTLFSEFVTITREKIFNPPPDFEFMQNCRYFISSILVAKKKRLLWVFNEGRWSEKVQKSVENARFQPVDSNSLQAETRFSSSFFSLLLLLLLLLPLLAFLTRCAPTRARFWVKRWSKYETWNCNTLATVGSEQLDDRARRIFIYRAIR